MNLNVVDNIKYYCTITPVLTRVFNVELQHIWWCKKIKCEKSGEISKIRKYGETFENQDADLLLSWNFG